jgi:anti-anti-sigma factor
MYIKGDHAELAVGGRLDVRSAADARTVLHSAVDSGRGDLVLDLTELDSWDATGLGVIMEAHRRAGRANRRLVLRGVPPQMERLLIAIRLHRILTIDRPAGRQGEADVTAGVANATAPAVTPAAPSVAEPLSRR